MTPDEKTWEREVEQELARWSAELAVEVPSAVQDRTRAVVRAALDQQWLGDRPTVLPTEAAVDRVRTAVRRELAQARPATAAHDANRVRVRPRAWPQRYVWASLATAASVLVVIGLVRQRAPSESSLVVEAQPRDDTIDLFVQAAGRAWADDRFTSGLRMDLDALEQNLSDWSPAATEVERMLEDIGDRLDGLFDERNADEVWPTNGWTESYS